MNNENQNPNVAQERSLMSVSKQIKPKQVLGVAPHLLHIKKVKTIEDLPQEIILLISFYLQPKDLIFA